MPYSPVELRHVRLGRSLFGYKRDATERLLDEVAASFEDVWRERGELTDQVDELSKQLEDIRGREHLLASTLVAAEKSAADSRDAAKRQAELILAEAHQEARSITRSAQNQRERLFAEARRVEVLLRGALGIVEESQKPLDVPAIPDDADAPPEGAAAPATAPAAAEFAGAEDAADSEAGEPPVLAQSEVRSDPWPNREDTAEFPSLINIRSEVDPDQL
jgi:cell division initiation protein